MGAKSRGNWRVEWCSEVECENRDKLCHSCIARSALKKRSMVSTARLNGKHGVGYGLGVTSECNGKKGTV
jgi:hypothetical protein